MVSDDENAGHCYGDDASTVAVGALVVLVCTFSIDRIAFSLINIYANRPS